MLLCNAEMVLCMWYIVYQKTQEGTAMSQVKTFEMTYVRYPFAPLVALGVAIAAAFKPSGGNVKPAKQGDQGMITAGQQFAA